jgi:acyl-coenzyme A thioesterase PaaI-like protein
MKPSLKERLGFRFWMMFNVRMLAFVRPRILDISDDRVVARIRLNSRSRNHLGSMYFGALAAGADFAGGLLAMRHILRTGNKVSLIFGDVHGDFLKRADGDVHFTSENGQAVRALVEAALSTGERQNMPVHIVCTVPEKYGDEPVAKFTLTLSLKRRS